MRRLFIFKTTRFLGLLFLIVFAFGPLSCSSSQENPNEGIQDGSNVQGQEGVSQEESDNELEVSDGDEDSGSDQNQKLKSNSKQTNGADLEENPFEEEGPVQNQKHASKKKQAHKEPKEAELESSTQERESSTGKAWIPESWENHRFLDRSGFSPERIFNGEVVFVKPGDNFNEGRLSQIKSSNPHLRNAKSLVCGDHFHRPNSFPPVQFGKGEYTVIKGDSLQKIADRLYGSSQRWLELYFLNSHIAHFDRLEVGQKIHFLDSTQMSQVHHAPPAQTQPSVEELDEPMTAGSSESQQQPMNQNNQATTPPQEEPIVQAETPSPPPPTPVPPMNSQPPPPPPAVQAETQQPNPIPPPPQTSPYQYDPNKFKRPDEKPLWRKIFNIFVPAVFLTVLGWWLVKLYLRRRQRGVDLSTSLTDELETYSSRNTEGQTQESNYRVATPTQETLDGNAAVDMSEDPDDQV